MRRELMVFAKFSSNYARTIKAAIFWERDKCFLFWTVSTSCAHYSRHYENKLPVDMRLLPCLSLIPLTLHGEGQKANGERWERDGEEERWGETRAPEYFCGNYACSIHKEEIFFLKHQRTASCTWIIWFPVPLLSFKRKAVVGDYSIARRKYNDFAESWKVLVFLSLMQETEENETSFYNILNFYRLIRRDRFWSSEINELKENRLKIRNTRACSPTEGAICGCGCHRISRKSCTSRLSRRVNHEGQMSVLPLSHDDAKCAWNVKIPCSTVNVIPSEISMLVIAFKISRVHFY